MTDAAVSVRGLRKSYGRNEAVRGIDFEVQRGEVFGFLGPNGAARRPRSHLADGLQNTFFPTGGGTGLQGTNVTSLVVWGLAGLIIAVRRFKWEPQGPGHE
jgi:ABC-2 type transport system ATP-binding protein